MLQLYTATLRSLAIILFAVSCYLPANTMADGLQDFALVKSASVPPPLPLPGVQHDVAQVTHGRYLVGLLGCGSCHTDGMLIGRPNMDHQLAGSQIGIAYTNPLQERHPGVVFPANITPDKKTGIGNWSDEALRGVIRRGMDQEGRQHLGVMPWPAYASLNDDDTNAIIAYLRNIEPVTHTVPGPVKPGTTTREKYVHFGVYFSRAVMED